MSETEGRLLCTEGWSAQCTCAVMSIGQWALFSCSMMVFLFCYFFLSKLTVVTVYIYARDFAIGKQSDTRPLTVSFFSWLLSSRSLESCCPLSFRLFNGLNGVKIENQGKQSMLVFFNVSEEDYGNYTCVAMNTMGITNASIILYGKNINAVYIYIKKPETTNM